MSDPISMTGIFNGPIDGLLQIMPVSAWKKLRQHMPDITADKPAPAKPADPAPVVDDPIAKAKKLQKIRLMIRKNGLAEALKHFPIADIEAVI